MNSSQIKWFLWLVRPPCVYGYKDLLMTAIQSNFCRPANSLFKCHPTSALKNLTAGPHPIGQKGQLVKRSLGPRSQIPNPRSHKFGQKFVLPEFFFGLEFFWAEKNVGQILFCMTHLVRFK